MTEGAIIMLAHATQNVHASEFPARGTERLNCCCHRCAMHTLVTRSEIEPLDTAYVCSCSTRWLTLAAVAVVFIYFFFTFGEKPTFARRLFRSFSAAIQRVEVSESNRNSECGFTKRAGLLFGEVISDFT